MKSLKTNASSTKVASEAETVDRPPVLPGVLVIHEDKLMRIMLKLGLKRHGFQVWAAADSKEAAQLYRRHRKQLAVIVLSYRVAGIEGHPTLEALREVPMQTPICFLVDQSAETSPAVVDGAPVAHLLTEPFDMEEIRRVVRKLAQAPIRAMQAN